VAIEVAPATATNTARSPAVMASSCGSRANLRNLYAPVGFRNAVPTCC